MAGPAQQSEHSVGGDDFVSWVVQCLNTVEGEHGWEAPIRTLKGHVRMAAKLLSDGDTMRRSKLAEPQDVSCCLDEYWQVISLGLWVRICGARGRSVASDCIMEAGTKTVRPHIRMRRYEAGSRWMELEVM